MSELVVDEICLIFDGYIVLLCKLVVVNYYLVIDVLYLVSWVMNQIVDDDQCYVVGCLCEWLVKYEEVELLLKIGEYQKGQDSEVDQVIEKIGVICQWLCQGIYEISDYVQVCVQLWSFCV